MSFFSVRISRSQKPFPVGFPTDDKRKRVPTSSRIEWRSGRDHFGGAFSAILAGGGVKGGALVGKTSEDGSTVTDRKTSPADLLATVCLALGLDPATEFGSRDGRKLGDDRPVAQQMASGTPVRLLPKTINPVREVLA